MEDSLALCASAFVRNKGKNVFTENDLLMGLSMDLRWMTYSEAKLFLSAMVTAGLFERSGDMYRAAFSNNEIDVPVAYKPSRELIEKVQAMRQQPAAPQEEKKDVPVPKDEVPKDMMPTLMKVAVENGIDRREFMMQSNSISRRLGIFIEVAALYVLRDNGVDITGLADKVCESVKMK